jgi:hypothetical protein
MRDQDTGPGPVTEMDELNRLITTGFDNLTREGAQEANIKELQTKVGVELPPSYKRFLELTDGATLYQTDELFGANTIGNTPGVAEARQLLMNESKLPPHLLPIGRKGGLYYALDLNKRQPDGEFPVNVWNPRSGVGKEVAPSFKDHLKRIVAVHQPTE